MRTVFSTSDDFRAQLVKNCLEQAGVNVCLNNENINSVMPYSSVIAEMQLKVDVDDVDYERSSEIVGSMGFGEAVTVCPVCGSVDVVYGIKGKSRAAKIFAVVLATLTMSPLGKVKCEYYCNSCKNEF